jgi:hypothetical protein
MAWIPPPPVTIRRSFPAPTKAWHQMLERDRRCAGTPKKLPDVADKDGVAFNVYAFRLPQAGAGKRGLFRGR